MSMGNIVNSKNKFVVSVVLASYNGEAFIAEQIDSILSQTYTKLELIICDDGSTDGTVDIIKKYMKVDPSISLRQNSETLGFVKNFEKGIAEAQNDYIALCDQDDIWEVNKLEIQMAEMLRQEHLTPMLPVMIHSDLSVVNAKGLLQQSSYFTLKHYGLNDTKDLGQILGPCGVMGNTTLFNRALKEKILPFPDAIAFHDQWIALVTEVYGRRVTVKKPLVRYRIHQRNSSNKEGTVKHEPLSLFSSFLKGEIKPPYLGSARAGMIEKVLEDQTLEAEDKKILECFLHYLKGKKGSWKVLMTLWKHDLIKRDMGYRLAFSVNYLLFKEQKEKIYLFGFSHWKRSFIQPFFMAEGKMVFCATLKEATQKGLKKNSKVYIWGKRSFSEVESYVEKEGEIFRVEDGFIRSVSLGSDLTKAYSLVIDRRGIYFDPNAESDLEYLIKSFHFDDEIIARAQKLQSYLRENRISKYNMDKDRSISLTDLGKDQKSILVPGQVEDDASIFYGANGMTNLELLERVRDNAPDAYILFKPHPDVLAGNRKGDVSPEDAAKHCDMVIENVSLDSVLDLVDEVHTMTSLVGFEALIRGKTVHTYGLPFYAGWGLTTDEKRSFRRDAERTLDELVAAALICYPHYINPSNNASCEVEVLLEEIDKEKKRYNNILYKAYRDGRNIVSRKIQQLIKVFSGE